MHAHVTADDGDVGAILAIGDPGIRRDGVKATHRFLPVLLRTARETWNEWETWNHLQAQENYTAAAAMGQDWGVANPARLSPRQYYGTVAILEGQSAGRFARIPKKILDRLHCPQTTFPIST